MLTLTKRLNYFENFSLTHTQPRKWFIWKSKLPTFMGCCNTRVGWKMWFFQYYTVAADSDEKWSRWWKIWTKLEAGVDFCLVIPFSDAALGSTTIILAWKIERSVFIKSLNLLLHAWEFTQVTELWSQSDWLPPLQYFYSHETLLLTK